MNREQTTLNDETVRAQSLQRIQNSQKKHIILGFLLVAMLVLGLGGWATFAQLNGAVIAAGKFVVEGNIKKVQHQEGGIVGQILVRNGDHVFAGDLLVKLDDTVVAANLAVIAKQLAQMRAQKARLEAEWQGKDAPEFDQDLLQMAQEMRDARLALEGQTHLMQARLKAQAGRKQQLSEQAGQLEEQIKGLTIQRDAKARGLSLVQEQLADYAALFDKRLISESQVTGLKRQEAELAGEHGATISRIAQTRQSISEKKLQILQLDQDFLEQVLAELQQVQAKIAELEEQMIAGEDRMRRIEIRAPQDGIIHQLNVHTVGGVVSAAEPLMMVVPENAPLIIEARLQPLDVDQVHQGQEAIVRIPAFDQRSTPELAATVKSVSADLEQDPITGEQYYRATLSLNAHEEEKLGKQELVSGLPVEAFIQTGGRSALSYFIKPLRDQIAHALKES
ncbi:HlyD family type I secretion periplasmic adaptor subunit [Polycladidibacter stylochi]|uniref:HlyD family type I secretion periplasmic adaptor subunit n=1 Tax=Polycladidibacter stylochi TaxID=1807766 RepID=UPI0008348042|nr:HlyD family type I secretion periplasmic adaptor subunit [Pseudovibrio stylochi]